MRHWQPCRVCGKEHTNPQSSSICPGCGAAEAAASRNAWEMRNRGAYTDADRFRDPVDVALEQLSNLIGDDQAEAVKALVEAMIEDVRR